MEDTTISTYKPALSQDGGESLDVLDLPQLYQKPSAEALFSVLADLSLAPPSWEVTARAPIHERRRFKSEGVPGYLTRIVSSPLAWITGDDDKERIWELASQRLSERSGRTAMGAIQRTFRIPKTARATDIPDTVDDDNFQIRLHEPALTEDKLGLKTWASSFLLAKRLSILQANMLPTLPVDEQILELGSGTGLVGLAAAVVLQRPIVLTDLPEIVSNLEHNIQRNKVLLGEIDAEVQSAVLDWTKPGELRTSGSTEVHPSRSFRLVLAADPIYSSEHPNLFAQAVDAQLSRHRDARVVVELPLREAYLPERRDLIARMEGIGLERVSEDEEVGYDDWSTGLNPDGEQLAEVRCWWSVWAWDAQRIAV